MFNINGSGVNQNIVITNNNDTDVTMDGSDGSLHLDSSGITYMGADGGVLVGVVTPGGAQGSSTVNATGLYVNGTGWYSGGGSPEAAVTAGVGSIYSRQDSAIGDPFYFKVIGSGNTEWAPIGTVAPITTVTTTYSATNSDGTINCNGTFTVTLASSGVPTGKIFNIKNIGTGIITVSSDVNIDFALTQLLPTQGQSLTVQWDGTQWWIY